LTSASRLESSVARPLAAPRPARVEIGPDGLPRALGGTPVEAIREEWIVEDGWWTERPLRRRYLELALADGRNVAVFHDLTTGQWLSQRV
jgi:hypothetical protein